MVNTVVKLGGIDNVTGELRQASYYKCESDSSTIFGFVNASDYDFVFYKRDMDCKETLLLYNFSFDEFKEFMSNIDDIRKFANKFANDLAWQYSGGHLPSEIVRVVNKAKSENRYYENNHAIYNASYKNSLLSALFDNLTSDEIVCKLYKYIYSIKVRSNLFN